MGSRPCSAESSTGAFAAELMVRWPDPRRSSYLAGHCVVAVPSILADARVGIAPLNPEADRRWCWQASCLRFFNGGAGVIARLPFIRSRDLAQNSEQNYGAIHS